MTTYGQTVETLCGSNGIDADAAEIAAGMNGILRTQGIEITVATSDDAVRDDEHRTAIQGAWERALRLLSERADGAILNPAIAEFCEDNNLPLPAQIETANAAWEVAGDDLTIQASDMVTLFPGRPEMHTTTRFRSLLAGALR